MEAVLFWAVLFFFVFLVKRANRKAEEAEYIPAKERWPDLELPEEKLAEPKQRDKGNWKPSQRLEDDSRHRTRIGSHTLGGGSEIGTGHFSSGSRHHSDDFSTNPLYRDFYPGNIWNR